MALALVVGAGCTAPDRPPRLAADLAPEALAWLEPDSARVLPVATGVWYRSYWSPKGPWAVHLLEVDLRRCALSLDVVRAATPGGGSGGHERVSSMVRRHPGRVLAAVNGDFFTPEGRPLGPEVSRGVARRGGRRPALAWRDGASPVVATVAVTDGAVSGIGWELPSPGPGAPGAEPDPAGEIDVVGGFPELLDGGARVGDLGVQARPGFAASRHPRTAAGYDADGERLWLIVVDGRQGAYSTGMTLPEVTTLLEHLGADEALNLDGGGSSVMVVGNRVLSRPSDPEGERPVVNALVVKEDRALCRR